MNLAAQVRACAEASLAAGSAWFLFHTEKEKVFTYKDLSFVVHYLNRNVYPAHKKTIRPHPHKDPLLPPYPQHKQVAFLGDGANHYLLVNRSMVTLGHTVISCADPARHQGDPVDLSDCHAIAQVLAGHDYIGLTYYNCGIDAGCSQLHKHLQFAPLPYNPILDVYRRHEKLPWQYRHVELPEMTADHIFNAYRQVHEEFGKPDVYNFIVAKGVAVLVPRRKSMTDSEIISNSLTVCGHWMIWEEQGPEVEADPIAILTEVCVPVE
jgi:ATP adenylyltransferase/5',5'''-P-1,P-4-tetraphosphate phosphorylase II